MRERKTIKIMKFGNETYVMPDVDPNVSEFYVVEYSENEAIIEIPEQVLIEKIQRKVEEMEKKLQDVERRVRRFAPT